MKRKFFYPIAAVVISGAAWAQSPQKDSLQRAGNNGVMQNTVVVDSMKKDESIRDITQKVVEATYKNYPQQPGQPTIIINNIILPPDYNKSGVAPQQAPLPPTALSYPDPKDDPEYQMWLRERSQQGMYGNQAMAGNNQGNTSGGTRNRMTFQDRFGERPMRNSGTWVIPVVGVHASGFKANFDNDEFKGRTGWNAGLDVRMRAKRFFVQPGLHYFNSSLEITDKDSLSEAKLLDGPRIHSLKLPVLLGIYLTKANSGFFKFNIKAGAVGNYLLAVDKSDQPLLQKDNLHDFSYGAIGGIGLEFGLITLDFTHEWGITKFFKNSDEKNNILRATLGMKI